MSICLFCFRVVGPPYPQGVLTITLSRGIPIFSLRKFICWIFFFVVCFSLCLQLWKPVLLPPVIVVCSRAPCITMTAIMAPTFGLSSTGYSMMWFCYHSWYCGTELGVLLALLHCSSNILSPRCLLRHMATIPMILLRWVFHSGLSIPLIHNVVCCYLLWCLLSAFRFPCGCHACQWGLNYLGLQCHNPMEYTFGRHMCLLVMVCVPCQYFTKWLLLLVLWVGGSFMLLIQLFPSHSINIVGHTAVGRLAESHPIPLPSLHGREGLLSQVVTNPMTH